MKNKIKLFIYTLIGISLPFLIRTTLYTYTIRNINSPYATIYLHSLDIILLFIFVYLFWKTKRFPLSRSKIVDKLWITLFFWIFIQLLWAQYPLITWFWGVRFYFGIGLIWYIRELGVFRQEINYIFKGFFIGMLGQALIVVMQIWLQKNIGLPLVVESTLSPEIAGVAKVSILDNIIIRGYGTFPHPNILAFSGILALLLLYTKEFTTKLSIWIYLATLAFAGTVDHHILTSIQAFILSILVGIQLVYGDNLKVSRPLRQIFIVAFHTIIILSFSKTALTLLLLLDFIYLTSLSRKWMFHVEQFQNKLKSLLRLLFNSMAVAGILILWILPYRQIIDTIMKRGLYLQDAVEMIYSNLWLGVGLGQYVVNLPSDREIWQYEPVHNATLLLLSEVGLIGGVLVLLIIGLEWYTLQYGYKKQG
jgi:hypothetical protein